METFAKDFVSLIQYLLPGFITAWMLYNLTSHPKPSQFERVVQALIFTILVKVFVNIIRVLASNIGNKFPAFQWDSQIDLMVSVLVAFLFGILFSYFLNSDILHKKLRDWGITRETSFPSEWFGAFHSNVTFIVLHLDGERRLYGWPIEWPSESEKGHFVLVQASWLELEESGEQKEIPLLGVDKIMIDVKEVVMVEFMEKLWEAKNGKESIKSTATEA